MPGRGLLLLVTTIPTQVDVSPSVNRHLIIYLSLLGIFLLFSIRDFFACFSPKIQLNFRRTELPLWIDSHHWQTCGLYHSCFSNHNIALSSSPTLSILKFSFAKSQKKNSLTYDNSLFQLTAAHCVVGGHTPVAVRLGVSRITELSYHWNLISLNSHITEISISRITEISFCQIKKILRWPQTNWNLS